MHRWFMDEDNVCRCKRCDVLWDKKNREADDCPGSSPIKKAMLLIFG